MKKHYKDDRYKNDVELEDLDPVVPPPVVDQSKQVALGIALDIKKGLVGDLNMAKFVPEIDKLIFYLSK